MGYENPRASLEYLPDWISKGPVDLITSVGHASVNMANASVDMMGTAVGGVVGTPMDGGEGQETSLDEPVSNSESSLMIPEPSMTKAPTALDDVSQLSEIASDPYAKVAIVRCDSSNIPPWLKHSVTTAQFLKAQFNHPGLVAQFQAFFVCGNGKDAAVMRDNQSQYHPMQRSYAFALADEALQGVLQNYERSFGSRQEEDFLLLQTLAVTSVPPVLKQALRNKPGPMPENLSGQALAFAQHLEAESRLVLVLVDGASSVPPQHAKLLTHSLSCSQFLFAQFYHANIMAGYVAIFLSKNEKYAKTVAENQHKYHPNQKVVALSLSNSSVLELLESYAKSFSFEQNELFSFALMLSATIVPPTRMLAPAVAAPEGNSGLHHSAKQEASGTPL